MNEPRSSPVLDIMPHQLAGRTIFLTSLTVQLLAGLLAGCALVAPIESHGSSMELQERDVVVIVQPPGSARSGTGEIDDAGVVHDQAAPTSTSDDAAIDAAAVDAGPTGGCLLADAAFSCPTNRSTRYVCDRAIAASCVDGGASEGQYYYCC